MPVICLITLDHCYRGFYQHFDYKMKVKLGKVILAAKTPWRRPLEAT